MIEKLYKAILSKINRNKKKYLSILIPLTLSHLTSLIWLPSPPLHQNLLSQSFFVNLLVSFSEAFSVPTSSSQSTLTMSFPYHVTQSDALICLLGGPILISCTSMLTLY